ncbi:MAG: sodium-translocating pyrophosphatase [Candidatus Njordarchaeia archaeon]
MVSFLIISFMTGLLALAVVSYYAHFVLKQETGTKRMQEVASYIFEGAKAFMYREMTTILVFSVVLSIIIFSVLKISYPSSLRAEYTAISFLVGAFTSLLAAYIGMNISVKANVRVAQAARKAASDALKIAFRGGSVTGLSIVGLSLIAVTILFYLLGQDPTMLVGFGFGASFAALFAQLGGGIYTKSADIGADLVGKVEKGIPEDDPRNPAVIADLVGDNVGDCAGRGADLFESFSDNMIATMILGELFTIVYGPQAIIFPLMIQSIGVIGSAIGTMIIGGKREPIRSIYLGYFVAGVITTIGFYFIATQIMGDWTLFICALLGLFATLIIAYDTIYYTHIKYKPVKEIAESSTRGPAMNILIGFAYGLESPFIPILVIGIVIMISFFITSNFSPYIGVVDPTLLGVYGATTAFMGIMGMTGVIMSSDTYGPIVDNADGIVELTGIKEEVGISTELMDAAGNVTKAITKGYSMATALLTAIGILFAYIKEALELNGHTLYSLIDVPLRITKPEVLVGMLVGAAVPFLFSAWTLIATQRGALKMVDEVRRQFRENPGILEGKVTPNYWQCVDISTKHALKEMTTPTLLIIVIPIMVGLILGIWALAGYLISIKIVSAILAMVMFNAGGAWDNAKKLIEANGAFGGEGSEAHKGAVIGDTVGDPLKDTAGPALHIVIKLSNILAISLLPLFVAFSLM